jgi:2-oxo-3-hexenedioate decarboxylase
MKAAQDGAHQIPRFTEQYPDFDLPAAYAVSNLIHHARLAEGARAVGRKIGFTNPDMWALYGVRAPIWAHVYDATVIHLRPGPARCSLRGFTEPKVEPEIVFHFRAAPPVGGDLAAVLASIDWVAHGFEIVQSHFAGWRFRAADTVADWALHGRLLVGPPQPVNRLGSGLIEALESFSISLACNGEVREVGRGSNVLGSPLAAVAHLIAVLAAQPDYPPLQAGELVTTGTVTPAQQVLPGQTWRTELSGLELPGLNVAFEA